jgi:TonB family protein
MIRLANIVLIITALIPASAAGQVCVEQIRVPKYPALAWAAQWTGAVELTVTIGRQGQVVRVEGIGPFPYLVEQAKANVKEWVFCTPENQEGAHVRLRYDYRLEGARVYRPPTAKVTIDLGDAMILIGLPPPAPQP